MKTSRLTKLTKVTSFASLPFPRYISTDIGKSSSLKQRKERYSCTGGYYTPSLPTVNPKSSFFYLNSDFAPSCRVQVMENKAFRSEVEEVFPLVLRLSHERFLAGWSLGDGMASEVFYEIFQGEGGKDDAQRMAIEHARVVFENMEEVRELEALEEDEYETI